MTFVLRYYYQGAWWETAPLTMPYVRIRRAELEAMGAERIKLILAK
jgi:hypothetical protein